MKKIKSVIIDDEKNAIHLLSALIDNVCNNLDVIATFSSWKDALKGLKEMKPDIVFLDIEMPEKSGINLLYLLPELDAEIIFVTAHDEYALEAFKHFATGYILKPVSEQQLITTINKAISRIHHKNSVDSVIYQNSILEVPDISGYLYVNIDDIVCLIANNRCTKVITTCQTILSSYHLAVFKGKIEHNKIFFQTHRSYIINMKYISRYEKEGILTTSLGHKIPVAKDKRKELIAAMRTR